MYTHRHRAAVATRHTRGAGRAGLWIAALCALSLCALVVPANASGEGEVAVGGEHILTVRFPANGMTVSQRADAVTERLRVILSDPNLRPSDIVAVPMGRTAARILVKGRLLVTVEPETARYNREPPLALARQWAAHLRNVLPEVNVKPNPNIERPDRHSAH